MVNRVDPPANGGAGFFQMLEGLPPGLLAQLGSILGKLGQNEGMNPEELTKLVQKILLTQKQDGSEDAKKILHLVKLIPSKETLPPEMVKKLEKMELAPKLDQGVKTSEALKKEVAPKSEANPGTQGPPKTDKLLKVDYQIRPKESSEPPFRSDAAAKQVVRALNLLIPHTEKEKPESKEGTGAKSQIQAPKEGAEADFMAKDASKVLPKKEQKPAEKQEIHVTLNPLKEGHSLERKSFDKQGPAPELPSAKHVADKGFLGLAQQNGKAGESAAQQVQQQVAHQGEKVIIPGAPYTPQAQTEARRKEKKAKPREHWDQDQSEDDSDADDNSRRNRQSKED